MEDEDSQEVHFLQIGTLFPLVALLWQADHITVSNGNLLRQRIYSSHEYKCNDITLELLIKWNWIEARVKANSSWGNMTWVLSVRVIN